MYAHHNNVNPFSSSSFPNFKVYSQTKNFRFCEDIAKLNFLLKIIKIHQFQVVSAVALCFVCVWIASDF